MKLNDYFKEFIGQISLNPTRVDRIESAVRSWESKLADDSELKNIFKDFYTQGSYSTNTGIKPKANDEFDVDVILLLDITDEKKPTEIINLIKDRIKSYDKSRVVNSKDRCVRINYVNDFHVDVVPAFSYQGVIKIPSKKEGEWTKTNPKGFKEWCDGVNKDSNNYFTGLVKLFKYWRNENVGSDTAPKSILLTTLVGSAFIKKSSYAETLIDTLEQMITNIDFSTKFLINDDEIPQISNPSLLEENLARNWSKLKAVRFNKKLIKLKEKCQEALEESDKEKSIKKWQDIFGTNYFPSELNNAALMAKDIKLGEVLANSKGNLNKREGTLIKDHRFYGEEGT